MTAGEGEKVSWPGHPTLEAFNLLALLCSALLCCCAAPHAGPAARPAAFGGGLCMGGTFYADTRCTRNTQLRLVRSFSSSNESQTSQSITYCLCPSQPCSIGLAGLAARHHASGACLLGSGLLVHQKASRCGIAQMSFRYNPCNNTPVLPSSALRRESFSLLLNSPPNCAALSSGTCISVPSPRSSRRPRYSVQTAARVWSNRPSDNAGSVLSQPAGNRRMKK